MATLPLPSAVNPKEEGRGKAREEDGEIGVVLVKVRWRGMVRGGDVVVRKSCDKSKKGVMYCSVRTFVHISWVCALHMLSAEQTSLILEVRCIHRY